MPHRQHPTTRESELFCSVIIWLLFAIHKEFRRAILHQNWSEMNIWADSWRACVCVCVGGAFWRWWYELPLNLMNADGASCERERASEQARSLYHRQMSKNNVHCFASSACMGLWFPIFSPEFALKINSFILFSFVCIWAETVFGCRRERETERKVGEKKHRERDRMIESKRDME